MVLSFHVLQYSVIHVILGLACAQHEITQQTTSVLVYDNMA